MLGPHRPVDDDVRLLTRLAAVAREVDPPPEQLYALGRATFELYRIDDELAELVADSRLDSHAVRAGASDIRLLSFESAGATLELQITGGVAVSSILGQLVRPEVPGTGRAFLQRPGGLPVSVPVDAYGRFEFPEAPASLFRIRVELADSTSISTAWVTP
ncbi:MAG: hypothetical protein ACJ74U_09025 [Jatrophihabitantaceae bacterium]